MELDNLAPPSRRRRWRKGAMIGLPVALVGTLGAVAAPQAFASDHCEVDYRVVNSWGGGFQAAVDITAGSGGLDGWTVEWDFPSGTGVSSAWNVDYSTSGDHFTGSDVGWNGSIAAGQTREVFGFIGSGSTDTPTGFAVNGEACEGVDDPDPTDPEPTDPELDVSPTDLTVEAGSSAGFDVGFSEELDGAVDVTTTRTGGSTDLSVAAGGSLSFDSSNWDSPQTVTIAASEGAEGSATFAVQADGFDPIEVSVSVFDPGEVSDNEQRFLDLYGQLTGSDSPYLHESGVPYHSVEKLIVEAPDYGHQTTSEAMSYLMWLEAAYGDVTGDWGPYNQSWETTEQYMIPDMNPTNYDPSDPASYAPEADDPSKYPTQLDFDVPVGEDPIADELAQTYGTNQIYGMHWILDVDNGYGFGECGDGTTEPAYVNTFQRGLQESTWETVTHPSCETFDFGGENGFLDLFVGDDEYAQQERYTAAPDADARAVQVAWLAEQWAAEQGQSSDVSEATDKASMMGDYLRYAFADKYFKEIGDCVGANECAAGTGKNSFHYLLSWYYSWGAGLNGDWSFRIGGSGIHQGYQNVLAAYALSDDMAPDSPTAAGDWQTSLDAQFDFLEWLQSPEGAIAGGATNNWQGNYGEPTSSAQFDGMAYDWQPVWNDPPSNNWFGFQAWGMDDVATYYYHTGDERAGDLLDNWVGWVLDNSTITSTDYSLPGDLEWSGEPGSGLSVDVVSESGDPGVAGALAKVLAYYAAATDDAALQETVSDLLDAMWSFNDGIGISRTEERSDYCRFGDEVYIPDGWSGTMPNGDVIEPGSTFISIRSFMTEFEGWDQVQAYIDNGCEGDPPEFDYHRYWHQVEAATAFHTYAKLFE
ncbi:glycoside hydrolase family 48 protein [Glycomyces xiaoerkulensis]|uniref:glycoside hydrolase family 48 protein n=1 Tax=Glycomyces xiaoerkulensis TaxID=2038139 RepID=UPI0018E4909C|nr:glycoside hydrolase family 48 protein [Glycomyces xiaoerkulensis]